jgi:hypothetical protein
MAENLRGTPYLELHAGRANMPIKISQLKLCTWLLGHAGKR